MQCVEQAPQCVPVHGTCGGPGQQTQECCGSAVCRKLRGGDTMQCVEQAPQCVPVHGTCGGPGQQTQECCGNAVCEKLRGGDAMQCVARVGNALRGSASKSVSPLAAAGNMTLVPLGVEAAKLEASSQQCLQTGNTCGFNGNHWCSAHNREHCCCPGK